MYSYRCIFRGDAIHVLAKVVYFYIASWKGKKPFSQRKALLQLVVVVEAAADCE